MEALKLVLVMVLCVVMSIIVCGAMMAQRPVCTHDSTHDSALVTMEQFIQHCDHNWAETVQVQASIAEIHDFMITQTSFDKSVTENTTATLKSLKLMNERDKQQDQAIITNRDFIQQIADGMVRLVTTLKEIVEK